ncbi:ribosome maturation factor RimM [Sutcliffiella rhizosphaerae]|uniref:Ribosome maturation factor RimM n=1 Tax=Sutcliffiella rhizosphaerae TaxID=2880967 RepID=A0ABN8A9P6_9BACI|nr:ribosome maturation factor RimM [Sutcliffiella rhizosphaerae]CAG9619733.1 Ribosome maturation factor RimM [Sutcliffiella rhizosphaerae]
MSKWFNVGKLVNTHGIKGEVRVVSRTDFPEQRYQKGNRLYLFLPNEKEPVEVVVESRRVHKSFDLLIFKGYYNVNEVEKFKGAIVKVPEDQLEELEEGEYYFHEIVGCKVLLQENMEEIGTVKEVLTPGANDVWVVKAKKGKDILIPYIDSVVIKVDIKEKTIIIDPLEGLL